MKTYDRTDDIIAALIFLGVGVLTVYAALNFMWDRVALRLGRRFCVVRWHQYWRYAQECLVLARNAEDERTRASLLHMAQVWFWLAEERINETDERQSAEG